MNSIGNVIVRGVIVGAKVVGVAGCLFCSLVWGKSALEDSSQLRKDIVDVREGKKNG